MHKKILFITQNLKAGGAEKILTFLVNNLNSDIFSIKLIVLGRENLDTIFKINKEQNVCYLNKPNLRRSIIPLFKLIKKEKPNIVFSSGIHINVILGLFSFIFFDSAFIIREASVASEIVKYGNFKDRLVYYLSKFIYPAFKKIVCQCTDIQTDLIVNFRLKKNKTYLIPNPLIKLELNTNSTTKINNLQLLCVARLSKEKGIERIIQGLIPLKNLDFRLDIYGEGPLKESIYKLIEKNNLNGKITLKGTINHNKINFNHYDYYIQGSFVEGFPNSLLEAIGNGLPAIVFDCKGGTKDIVTPENAIIVENQLQFTVAIKTIYNNKEIFDVNKVKSSVENKFSTDLVLEKYTNLFLNI